MGARSRRSRAAASVRPTLGSAGDRPREGGLISAARVGGPPGGGGGGGGGGRAAPAAQHVPSSYERTWNRRRLGCLSFAHTHAAGAVGYVLAVPARLVASNVPWPCV